MRKYEIKNSLPYERDWYDKLETISYKSLNMIISYNQAFNQSADYKYRRIVYFINLFMNKYNRVDMAIKLIDKYWSKLPKSELLDGLFIYGDFEIFKKYWKKNRTNLSTTFIAIVFRTDEIERAKWLMNDKKFIKLIDDETVEFLASTPKERWSYRNDEAYDLLVSMPEISKIALEFGFENLYPSTVKDIFLF